jgi:hypothetical protein
MLRSYNKFSEADRRVIRKWQIRVTAFYMAILLGFLALVVINQEVRAWIAHATQADMAGSIARPASDPARMTSFGLNAQYP